MSKEIYDKKDIYNELNKKVYFRDGGSVNLASLASSVEKVRSNSNGSNSETSSNATKRFETEYVRGEDNIINNDNVTLGDFNPDIRFEDLKAGDIIDVAPKEEDITNVIFRNNGTESIHTQVHYASQDRDNFVPGTSYYCIRYERIADFPSDPNTQMSTLVFFRGWSSEDGAPVPPYFVFLAQPEETESGVAGLIPFVRFNSNGVPIPLNSDSGYVGFIEDESSSNFFCTEVVDNQGAKLTPKRQDDGVVSILDYYKFYYVAEGKTYVMSRSGDYVRPVDISKNVIENLREEVKSLKSEQMIDIAFESFLALYNTSDLDITSPKAEFASGFAYITGFDVLLDFCDVSVVDKLFFGKVRNIYGKISTGANKPLEPLAFKILYTVSEGQISKATVLLAPSESALQKGEFLMFEYSGGSTVTAIRTHGEA